MVGVAPITLLFVTAYEVIHSPPPMNTTATQHTHYVYYFILGIFILGIDYLKKEVYNTYIQFRLFILSTLQRSMNTMKDATEFESQEQLIIHAMAVIAKLYGTVYAQMMHNEQYDPMDCMTIRSDRRNVIVEHYSNPISTLNTTETIITTSCPVVAQKLSGFLKLSLGL